MTRTVLFAQIAAALFLGVPAFATANPLTTTEAAHTSTTEGQIGASVKRQGATAKRKPPTQARVSESVKTDSQPHQQKHTQTLEAIQVTGFLGSLTRAANTKKNNIGIVDSISAEEAGKFPDQTIAGALQRVPGVAVQYGADGEPNQISVRGFGPGFVNVLLNGSPVANTSFSTNAFNLDTLPVQLLKQAVVYKTSQANLPAGGIGGTVDIRTWTPLDFSGFHGSARVAGLDTFINGQQPAGNMVQPRLSALVGDTLDNDKLGWLAAVVYERRKDQWTGIGADAGSPWSLSEFPNANPSQRQYYPIDQVAEWTFQRRTRKALDLSVEYRPIKRLTITATGLASRYSGSDAQQQLNYFVPGSDIGSYTVNGQNTVTSFTTNHLGNSQQVFTPTTDAVNDKIVDGSINIKYRMGHGNTVALNYNQSRASNSTPYQWGANLGFINDPPGVDPVVFHNENLNDQEFPFYTGGVPPTDVAALRTHHQNLVEGFFPSEEIHDTQLGFKHEFLNGPVSSYDLGVSSESSVSQQYDTEFPDLDNFYQPFYGPFNVTVIPSAIDGHLTTFSNLGGPFGAGYPKTFFTYNPKLYLPFLNSSAALSQLSSAQRASFLSQVAALGGLPLRLEEALGTFNRVGEYNSSAYGIVNFAGSLGRHTWTAQLGVRYTRTHNMVTGYDQPLIRLTGQAGNPTQPNPTFAPVSSITAHTGYHFFLPSVNVKFHVTPTVIVRGAYSKTITRPDLSLLSPNVSYSVGNQLSVSSENPALLPYTSQNYDLGAGWYFGKTISYISLDVFKKSLSNFITTISNIEPITDVLPPTAFDNVTPVYFNAGAVLSRPVNLKTAHAEGFELTVNYRFKFLPGVFSHLGFAGNYTKVKSSATTSQAQVLSGDTFAIPGMGSSYNASLFFQTKKVSARFAFNYRGNYLVSIGGGAGLPVDAAGLGMLDFSGSYRLTPWASVFLDATNLTDSTIFHYQLFKDRPALGSEFARRVEVGVDMSF
ncbi:MAG TPA: TonB-dependent receptor [Rhodanobacteraceae bacterium]